MRNVEQLATAGKQAITERKELTVGEMEQLKELFLSQPTWGSGLFEVITKAFYFGYAVGSKAKTK